MHGETIKVKNIQFRVLNSLTNYTSNLFEKQSELDTFNYSVSIKFGKQSKKTINKQHGVQANGWFRVSIK